VEVIDTVLIHGKLPEVFKCFWEAELWPQITPHVKRIEMLQNSATYQRFRMDVASEGKLHSVESERYAVPNESIRYQQVIPPTLFKKHGGEWHFAFKQGDVEVTLTHRAELNEQVVLEALKVNTLTEAEQRIGATLRKNGMTTIMAVKDLIESGKAVQFENNGEALYADVTQSSGDRHVGD
jgi:hypothetical protein